MPAARVRPADGRDAGAGLRRGRPGRHDPQFTWIAEPSRKHPFTEPFAFALIQPDGADTALCHAVKASGPGTVALAMDLYYSGNTVILDHGGGLFTVYAHLSRIHVAAGDRVEAGRLIGKSGATGRVTGPHLHWGGKIGDLPFDPTALLDPRLWENRCTRLWL